MSVSPLDRFGIESISRMIMDKCLHWPGHVGCIGETRLPNIMLFGEMKNTKPAHGPRKHWRDLVSNDLVLIDGMNCIRIGTVGIRDVGKGSINCNHFQGIYVLSTGNLKVDFSYINVGEP